MLSRLSCLLRFWLFTCSLRLVRFVLARSLLVVFYSSWPRARVVVVLYCRRPEMEISQFTIVALAVALDARCPRRWRQKKAAAAAAVAAAAAAALAAIAAQLWLLGACGLMIASARTVAILSS